jgi:hypothetical protein
LNVHLGAWHQLGNPCAARLDQDAAGLGAFGLNTESQQRPSVRKLLIPEIARNEVDRHPPALVSPA